MSSKKFTNLISRIKALKKISNDYEVASLLGLGKTAFAERKRRDSIPNDKVALFCERESINMDWLLTGVGSPEKGTHLTPPSSISIISDKLEDYLTAREKEYTDKLKTIFRSKDEKVIQAITQNIDTFLRVPDAPKEKECNKKTKAG